MPAESARQQRSLLFLDHWKATEQREFILYTGPLALKDIVSLRMYDHFKCFHVAMTILLQPNDNKHNQLLPYARNLSSYFVEQSKKVYGNTFTVYNVHIMHFLSCSYK